MHLRSGTSSAPLVADTTSKAPTQGSNTRPTNLLDPISEETLESHSDTSSMATRVRESSETQSQDQETTTRCGKFTKNLFDNPRNELSLNIELQFQYKNDFGTDVYHDPLHCFAFKTAEQCHSF